MAAAMFEGFSFAQPSRRQRAYSPSDDVDGPISPTSWYANDPRHPSSYSITSAASTGDGTTTPTVAELASQLNRHSLHHGGPSSYLENLAHLSAPSPSSHPRSHNYSPKASQPASRRASTQTEYFNYVRLRRQSAGRLQCSTGHISSISVLVQRILKQGGIAENDFCASTHPSSLMPETTVLPLLSAPPPTSAASANYYNARRSRGGRHGSPVSLSSTTASLVSMSEDDDDDEEAEEEEDDDESDIDPMDGRSSTPASSFISSPSPSTVLPVRSHPNTTASINPTSSSSSSSRPRRSAIEKTVKRRSLKKN